MNIKILRCKSDTNKGIALSEEGKRKALRCTRDDAKKRNGHITVCEIRPDTQKVKSA